MAVHGPHFEITALYIFSDSLCRCMCETGNLNNRHGIL